MFQGGKKRQNLHPIYDLTLECLSYSILVKTVISLSKLEVGGWIELHSMFSWDSIKSTLWKNMSEGKMLLQPLLKNRTRHTTFQNGPKAKKLQRNQFRGTEPWKS